MEKNLKRLLLVFSLFCFVLGISITAYAAWSVKSYTINTVTTPTFGLKIEEDYQPPEEGCFPGIDVKKEVQVRNTGNTDALIRVKLTRQLGTVVDGFFKVDNSANPMKLLLNTNKQDWIYDEKEDWYYYRKVVKENEITTPVLYDFKLANMSDNKYQRLHGKIVVTAESVQYGDNGVSIWGKTYDYLGVKKPNGESRDDITLVEFLDTVRGFNIELQKADLFTNFKNLLAGQARSQRVCVRNSYKDPVNIRLSIMTDKDLNPDSTGRLWALLHEYGQIKIKNIDGTEVYNGPIGGGDNANFDLGNFEAREDRLMDISLSMRDDMPADYQNLVGKVKWVFEANEVDPPVNNKDPQDPKKSKGKAVIGKLVQTSELRLLSVGVTLIAISLIMWVILKRRKGLTRV